MSAPYPCGNGREPAVQFERLFSLAARAEIKKINRSRGSALAKPATHPVAPTPIASRIASSTPTSISRRWPSKARMAETRLTSVLDSLTASKFACFRRQFANLLGKKIRSVRDRIVVQHAGKRRGLKHSGKRASSFRASRPCKHKEVTPSGRDNPIPQLPSPR